MSSKKLWLALLGGALVVAMIAATVGGLFGFAVAWWVVPRLVSQAQPAQVISMPAPASAPAQSVPAQSAPAQSAPAPSAPAATSNDDAVIAAVAAVKPAVVLITNGRGAGSGVIIDEQGHILTNNHVVQGGRQFEVRFDNGSTGTARLIGTYPAADLAVIQVDGTVPAVARLGDSLKLRAGERVIAIGNALGRYTNSVTTGIVSATNRSLGGINGLIQHDAPINSGNSGGPLVNLAGEVVGINSMVIRGEEGTSAPVEGLGFSVPSAVARVVGQKLIAGQAVEWPYMGVGLEGVPGGMRVTSVEPNSGAAKAGLRQGDVITAVEGYALNPDMPVSTLLLGYGVGGTVKVAIQRDGQNQTLQVVLGKRPASGS